jgi:hypothetical protein
MLRHLVVSAFIVGSAALMAPRVNAQSLDLPFSGSVPTNCTFNNTTPGTLTVSGSTLSSTNSGGANASVNVTCLSPVRVTLSAPIQTGGPTFTPTQCNSALFIGGQLARNVPACDSTGTAIAPISGSQAISASMSVTGAPPGDYNYKVILTLTP